MTQTPENTTSESLSMSYQNKNACLNLISKHFFLVTVLLFSACATADVKKNTPTWPNNGIAQREFYGDKMFVENHKGKWHAWVVSSPTRWKEWNRETSNPQRGEALNFFSGEKTIVYPGYTEDMQSLPEFRTLKNKAHNEIFIPTNVNGYYVYDFITVGLRNKLANLDFNSGIKSPFRMQKNTCPLTLSSVIGYSTHHALQPKLSSQEKPLWRKAILYHEPISKGCPSGRWESLIVTALDLNDGTFLATTERYVFRLRLSDLSPVGSAPNLYVFDADVIENALMQKLSGVDAATVVDQQAFLASALQLKINTNLKREGVKND